MMTVRADTATHIGMKQNIYDNPIFFDGYSELRRLESGLNAALEIPAMRSLIPPLAGKRVLDLGCGSGELCRLALNENASLIHGIDISRNMINLASKGSPESATLSYQCCAIEDFVAAPGRFDVVLSSLAVHYVKDWNLLCLKVSNWLSDGGFFVVSMEHPVCTATLAGWVKDEKGNHLHWPLDRYREEGTRVSRWFVDGVVKYHRSMESILNAVIQNGLQVVKILEPEALPEARRARPELADHGRRPPFLLVKAVKA